MANGAAGRDGKGRALMDVHQRAVNAVSSGPSPMLRPRPPTATATTVASPSPTCPQVPSDERRRERRRAAKQWRPARRSLVSYTLYALYGRVPSDETARRRT